MNAYHSDAVDASALLFRHVYGLEGLAAKPTSDTSAEADLYLCSGSRQIGLGEVKTLVNEERTKLSSELYGKKNRRFRTELPTGSGLWSVQVEPGANVKRGLGLLEDFFSGRRSAIGHCLAQVESEISGMGFEYLRKHPESSGDTLILNPAPTLFTPIDHGINPTKLFDFFTEKHSLKKSVQAVKNYDGNHRHIFLWPCETEFPGEVFAADDLPSVLPKPLERDWGGFSHIWIGHKYSMNETTARAWLLSRGEGWSLVEANAQP
jgi:hypothetical protein